MWADNKQTEFSFFFHCYASKISYIPTPDSHSQIVSLFYAVEYGLKKKKIMAGLVDL